SIVGGVVGDIAFDGLPDEVTAAATVEDVDERQVLRITFTGDFSPLGPAAIGTTTFESIRGGALLTSELTGGALSAAGGLADSSLGFSGLGVTAAGWAPYGTDGARAGVSQRVFMTDIGGAPTQATASATRSFVGGDILGGLARVGFG